MLKFHFVFLCIHCLNGEGLFPEVSSLGRRYKINLRGKESCYDTERKKIKQSKNKKKLDLEQTD